MDLDLEAQSHHDDHHLHREFGHMNDMILSTSHSLFIPSPPSNPASTNTSTSTIYEPRRPAPVHHAARAPAPAPITIPSSSFQRGVAMDGESNHELSASLHQPTPQSSRSALILQNKTVKRHRRSIIRRPRSLYDNSIWSSCLPLSSASPPSIRSKVLQAFLCGIFLASVFAVYLGLSVNNPHLSRGIQIPLLVLLFISGVLFVYVLLELCMFARRLNRVGGQHHRRLRSTVSFAIDSSNHDRDNEQQQQQSHHSTSTEHRQRPRKHHHKRKRHHHHHHHHRLRRRQADVPTHQIPLSPDDLLPNDDAIYTPTTPVRVHLLHDEEEALASCEKQAAVSVSSVGASITHEDEEIVIINESGIHPLLRTNASTARAVPMQMVGPTSPIVATAAIYRASSAASSSSSSSSSDVAAGGVRQQQGEEAGERVVTVVGKAPPPAYGLWRCSVRADPNLLHWRRIDSLSSAPISPSSGGGERAASRASSIRIRKGMVAAEGENDQDERRGRGEIEQPSAAAGAAASMLRLHQQRVLAASNDNGSRESVDARTESGSEEPPAYTSFVHTDANGADSS